MTSLLPLILVTFILQACVAAPEGNSINKTDRVSELKNDKLIMAINKFLKSLDLEQIIREFFSLTQGQMFMKLNQIRNGLNMNGDDISMIVSKIANAFETYTIKDLANLNEAKIFSIVENVVSRIRSYQGMIFAKIFAIADELGVDKSKASECVSNFVDIINILSEPNKVEEVVKTYKNEIIAEMNRFVETVQVYNLEPLLQSIINAMKEAPSKERS
ncbi:uncharacterized protein LOC123268224 isoform X2 [Cotesia glomerata]|uniref:Venom protein n=1 Tax=Cotesia glomerata TaxID=32391 RepID=A0AAV7HV70_COTGL|nr:uncharacterized protein LOC123268224 isoform X2 [Cotesia glomerata]KAH0535690.1 hypothetical protein KQX54_018237 [Cotesia glomerata]